MFLLVSQRLSFTRKLAVEVRLVLPERVALDASVATEVEQEYAEGTRILLKFPRKHLTFHS